MTALALNAKPILDARMRGFKPDCLTLVSLVGSVSAENHVVRAIPGNDYDWRWVHGLEICVYVGERLDWVDTMKAIAKCRPANLTLWNCFLHAGANVYLIPTADDVCQPVAKWQYELDYLSWMDFQNDDFINCTTYNRTSKGFPYATHS